MTNTEFSGAIEGDDIILEINGEARSASSTSQRKMPAATPMEKKAKRQGEYTLLQVRPSCLIAARRISYTRKREQQRR